MDAVNRQTVFLIYGRTNKHLGLWTDLESDNRVIMACAEHRESNDIMMLIRKICLKVNSCLWGQRSTYKHNLYKYHNLFKLAAHVQHILVIDGALELINISELEKCRKINKDIKISLYLLNSMDASSPLMRRIKNKIGQFEWNNIYTFDEEDANKYGYKYLGFNYYSSHFIEQSQLMRSDAYFAGGLKGGRTKTIYDVYKTLYSKGCKCDFNLTIYAKEDLSGPFAEKEGVSLFQEWRPYDEVLSHVQNTNCIVEIAQTGQSGATLRYFEAVSMNKKLLTNNKNIIKFPFYNPRWMKIFNSIEDIDVEWIREEENVDYGYNGEFSPRHAIDDIINQQ